MGIVSWIVFGLIAGAVAKWVMPGRDPSGWIITIIIGVVGAFIGGIVGTQIGWGVVTGFDLRSFLLAVLGSVILLAVLRLVQQNR